MTKVILSACRKTQFSQKRELGFKHNEEEIRERKAELSQPPCQFFEVHGSELKPDPVGNLSKAAERSITHGVFLFGIGKDALDFFLALFVKCFVIRRVTRILCQLNVVVPDVLSNNLFTVSGMSALVNGRTVFANIAAALVFSVTVSVGG